MGSLLSCFVPWILLCFEIELEAQKEAPPAGAIGMASGGKSACHAPKPTVVFQPCLAGCGTTLHFLFNNTHAHGLRPSTLTYLIHLSQLSKIH